MLQSYFAVMEQCAHLPSMKKSFDCAAVLLGINKGMYLVEGSEVWWSVHPQSLQVQVLSESSDMLQHKWWQICPSIRLDIRNNDCIEQSMSLLHQVCTVTLVLFNGLE
jgi:hypothetical protein